jgi:hypothetical protein
MDRIPYGEAHFYQDELIQCQSYYDDYTYYCGEVTMSDEDGMDLSTRVPVVRCVWAHVAMPHHIRH